ncbi:MAG: TRAP transporter substrate-binding protein [Betaproteobacteria bacterium]|jgi:tripartite ATP-independent transporter DctP family solute receptor|nr:TRAP transporter substrate-binding protein [Betaproteobacteria bacterium]NBT68243.1 TRAP transporter substrate-binding protein [Betaproteobacteria bacterium]
MSFSRRSVLSYAAGAASAMALPSVTRAQAGPINLVFSHHLPITHIGHKAAEGFANRVKAQTNGQVTVDIKPASQLFNLRTSAEALQLGTLDMCWSDLGTLANWTPSLGFVSLPFLFNDFDHVQRVLYGPIGKQVGDLAKDSLGVEILSLGASGFRVFLSKKPIQKADDARGIRLRVPEIPTWVEMAKAMGANPSPIPAGEMYTALQTGVVDAVELPADYIVTSKLYEVASFATKTHHIFTEVSMMASAKRMATFPANVQKVIRDNAVQAVQTEMWNANIKEQQDAWAELARRVKAFDAPDIASFRNKMGPVHTNFIGKTGAKGKAFVEAVQAAAKA